MLSTFASIRSLLLSFTLLSIGVGLNHTLIGLRGTQEHFSEFTIGLTMSAYYAGFILGTRVAEKLIFEVGQIRTFAAMASLLAAITLLYVLLLHPASWILLRFGNGMCMAAAYMVIESWLNALATTANRGRVLAIYMVLNSIGMASAQFLFRAVDTGTYVLFAISSLLASLAVVPIILSRGKQPERLQAEPLPLKRVFELSPIAFLGAISVGLSYSAFFGLSAPGMLRLGYSHGQAGEFLGCALLGGLLFQFPVGMLSDRFGRRPVVICLALAAALVAILIARLLGLDAPHPLRIDMLGFLFGAMTYPLYSCFLSMLNDRLDPTQFVKASSCILRLNGAGAIIGPLLASSLVEVFGSASLYWYIATIYGTLGGAAVLRSIATRHTPPVEKSDTVVIPSVAGPIMPGVYPSTSEVMTHEDWDI